MAVLRANRGRRWPYVRNNERRVPSGQGRLHRTGLLLTSEPIRAGVIGDPVLHSRSPRIHRAAAAAVGIEMDYRAIPVRPDELSAMIETVRSTAMRGLSVTMPHKAAVMGHLDELTPVAQALDAVNHITNHDGHLVGNNTDGEGFVLGLDRGHAVSVVGKRVLVLGAGGAARAIIWACAQAGASDVVVVARNNAAAERAAALGGDRGRVGSTDDASDAGIVVNATPVGMAGSPFEYDVPIDVSALREGSVVVDIVYNPLETPLLARARSRELHAVDGLAMLAGQAAAQFAEWTGIAAPIDVMLRAAAADSADDGPKENPSTR